MPESKRKYLNILKIEAKDLIEDIGVLVADYTKRRETDEITNYVFLENLAVLHNELSGVDYWVMILDTINPDAYESLDDMIQDIEERMKAKIKTSNLAEALLPLIKRKLEKVKTYLSHVAS